MFRRSGWFLGGLLGVFAGAASAAPSLVVLHSFYGPDGSRPDAQLALDQNGNLWGTTLSGGPGVAVGSPDGYGTVFELSGYNHFKFRTVLALDGVNNFPAFAPLLFDANGNLYGSLLRGGANGTGLVYELSGAGYQTFADLSDTGSESLVFDDPGASYRVGVPATRGLLIGQSLQGGANGFGQFFALSGPGHQTLSDLLDLTSTVDAEADTGPLVADAFGNLFGVQNGFGSDGSVFELSGPHHHTYTTLASFDLATTGAQPAGSLAFDRNGNLYGSTPGGGPNGGGTIFELSGADHRHLTILHSFDVDGLPNGTQPNGSLILDADGNIFGTTYGGGNVDNRGDTFGTIFELAADHQTFTVLYRFGDGSDGNSPDSGLISDRVGNLYGVNPNGGSNLALGIIYKLSNSGFKPLH